MNSAWENIFRLLFAACKQPTGQFFHKICKKLSCFGWTGFIVYPLEMIYNQLQGVYAYEQEKSGYYK